MSNTQYLLCEWDEKELAIEIASVETVVRMVEIVDIPNIPDLFKGFINFHGTIVPVMDIRPVFEVEQTTIDPEHQLVITRSKDQLLAFIVNRAKEVVAYDDHLFSRIDKKEEPVPLCSGFVKRDDQMIRILDVSKLFRKLEGIEIEGLREEHE